MPLRVLGADGSGSTPTSSTASSTPPSNGARVVNASLGGPDLPTCDAAAIAARPAPCSSSPPATTAPTTTTTPALPCDYTTPT